MHSCKKERGSNRLVGFREAAEARMVKIFVGNLTDECSNEDLQALFGQVTRPADFKGFCIS